MVLGEKLWEGKGKSGAGFIKNINMEGVTMEFAWTAQLKGMGCAEGMDCMINVTAISMTPPKGVGAAQDQGVLTTMGGDMAVIKGSDLSKMMDSGKPSSVGLWSFMTMSEKLGWLNDTIAVVVWQALDPMWQEFNMTVYEWDQ
jgi:hypothetical protein